MTKFNEKSVHSFALAFFYSAMQSFDLRLQAVDTTLERLTSERTRFHQLFTDFDTAYKQSLKSQLTKQVSDLDKVRDSMAYVIEQVAKLWATKIEDDALNIHGRRVAQVFRDYDFRTTEALVAENAKVENIEQRFAEPTLAADLEAMGLTVLNERLTTTTAQLKQLMQQRNEEQSTIVTGEVKRTRTALEQAYQQLITYLNAVQEVMPAASISQAAQYYNEDLRKVEQQIAQSRKGGTVSQKPTDTDGTATSGTTDTDNTGGSTDNNGGNDPMPSPGGSDDVPSGGGSDNSGGFDAGGEEG